MDTSSSTPLTHGTVFLDTPALGGPERCHQLALITPCPGFNARVHHDPDPEPRIEEHSSRLERPTRFHTHTAESQTPTSPLTPVGPTETTSAAISPTPTSTIVTSSARSSESSSQNPSLPTSSWPLVTKSASDSRAPSTSISTKLSTFRPASESASAYSSPSSAAGALPSNVSISRTPHLRTGAVAGIAVVAVCIFLAGILLYVKQCRGRRTWSGGVHPKFEFAGLRRLWSVSLPWMGRRDPDEHALNDNSTESSFAAEERTQTQTGDDSTDPPGSLASPLEPLSTTATDPRVTRGHRAADEKWVPDSPRNRTLTLSIPTHQSTGVRGVNRQTEPVFADSDGIISHGARHEMDGGVRLAGGRPGEPESPADSERDPVTSAPRGEASGYIVILPPPYSSHFGEAL